MANRSKQKGDREERDIVNKHRDLGFTIERTLESGARSDGSDPWDVNLETSIGVLKGECKLRASGFKTIYDWFDKTTIDFLTVRQDRSERLYIVPENVWFKIINALQVKENEVNLEND